MARHRSLRALLVALTLLAAACAGSDDSVSTEAADTSDDTAAEAAPATADESDAMADDTDADDTDASTPDDATGDDETAAPVSGPPPSLPPEEAAAAAEANIPNLQPSDDVRDVEVVSVQDGSITSLREVVTGDRPVLVWFWAPH